MILMDPNPTPMPLPIRGIFASPYKEGAMHIASKILAENG
jgi:hypothetical protein